MLSQVRYNQYGHFVFLDQGFLACAEAAALKKKSHEFEDGAKFPIAACLDENNTECIHQLKSHRANS